MIIEIISTLDIDYLLPLKGVTSIVTLQYNKQESLIFLAFLDVL